MKSSLPFLPLLLLGAVPLAGMASAMPWFEEVAVEAGIDFEHAGWVLDEHNEWFPEITPGGLCWLDYDGDGWQDLFFVTARFYNETLQAEREPRSELYRNRGDGTFEDVTEEAGVGLTGRWDMGCSTADYDGDGWEDLFVAGYDDDVLLRNRGDGTFYDATLEAGVADEGLCTNPCWGHSSSWVDYDLDGDLDLYVLNYVSWNESIHTGNGPRQYEGQRNLMWQNQGDGTFLEVSDATNTTDDPRAMHGKGLGAVWFDHNLDGCPDVYIASDQTKASLLKNNCNGHFEDIAGAARVDDDYSGMGTVAGDTNGDGRYDLYKTHYQGEPNSFYVYADNGVYDTYTHYGDLGEDIDYVGWGTGFFDFDNDGHLDVYVANGHTEHLLDWYGLTILGWQKNLLWLNDGEGNFTHVTNVTGPGWDVEAVTRGSAVADYDLDGDLDLAFNNNGNGTGHLLRNSNVTDTGHWLSLELRQPGLNWQAGGARVEIALPNGHTMTRHVMLGSGYLSQDQRALHVGLGDQSAADVTVYWPGGGEDDFLALAADQVLRLHKGGEVVTDTLAPLTTLDIDGTLGGGGWYTAPASLSLDASDTSRGTVSGVASTTWDISGSWADYDRAATLGEGVHEVAYHSEDAAGNAERIRRATIRVDESAPQTDAVVEGLLGDDGWYTQTASFSLVATDSASGVARTQYRLGADWVEYTGELQLDDGVHTLEWRSQDVAGHWENVQSMTIQVDSRAPATELMADGPPGEQAWYVGAVEADAVATDNLSGPGATWSRVDGGAWSEHSDPLLLGEGRHTVEAYSRDMAGNVEPVRTLEIAVDPTPPETTASVDGQRGRGQWYIDPPDVRLDATDATSDVARTEYRVDATWGPYDGPFTVGDGRHALEFRSYDNAGNVEAIQLVEVDVDTIAPISTLEISGTRGQAGWWLSDALVALAASDDGSGVHEGQLRINGAAWETYTDEVVLADGEHVVGYRSTDAAGNVEEALEATILVDTIRPSLTITVDGDAGEGGWLISNATVSLDGGDAGSGLDRIEYRLGADWKTYTGPFVLTEGVYELEARAFDVAGNMEAPPTRTISVDTTLPEISLALEGMHLWRGDEVDVVSETHFTLASGYDLSGVAWTEYSLDGGPWQPTGEFRLAGSDGEHLLTYRARDLAGNKGHAGDLVVHLLNDEAPSVRLVHPRGDSFYLGSENFRLRLGGPTYGAGCVPVRATTEDHVSGTRDLVIRVDGSVVASWHWPTWSSDGMRGAWTWDTLEWMPGAHVIEVEATDHRGNVAVDRDEVWTLGAPSPIPWCSLR